MRARRRWTEEEDRIIADTYPKRGAIGTTERLARQGFPRARASVQNRARKIGVQYDRDGGATMIPLVAAHARDRVGGGQRAHQQIVRAAARDGVLRRGSAHPHVYLAPIPWVDAYMARLDATITEERDLRATWLTTREVAALFGYRSARAFTTQIIPSFASKAARLHRHVERIPRKHVGPGTPGCGFVRRYWHRAIAEQEARQYRAATTSRRHRRRSR